MSEEKTVELEKRVDQLLMAVNALVERVEALENGYILAVQKSVGHAS